MRHMPCHGATACASATSCEAGNRVKRDFRGEFRHRVRVGGITTGVLSRGMDAAANQLLLAAPARGFERKPISGAQRRRAHRGTACGAILVRLKPDTTYTTDRDAPYP